MQNLMPNGGYDKKNSAFYATKMTRFFSKKALPEKEEPVTNL